MRDKGWFGLFRLADGKIRDAVWWPAKNSRITADLIDRTRKAMQQLQQGPLVGYMPYTRQIEGVLRSLAGLKPEGLAVMHGSSYRGQGASLLTDLAGVIQEEFDKP